MGMYLVPHHKPEMHTFYNLCNSTDDLRNCQVVCVDTAVYCMRMGGEYDHSGNIRLLLDCAQLCETTAELERAYGPVPERNYDLCAEMCERAARVCAMFPNDRMMLLGLDGCRRGATYCRQKAGMLV